LYPDAAPNTETQYNCWKLWSAMDKNKDRRGDDDYTEWVLNSFDI